jgi:hypothetical protein
MNETIDPQFLDGWRLDIGDDGVAASHPDGGSLVLFASGRIMSGGCDVPGNVVQVLRVELAKLSGGAQCSAN